MYVHAYQSLVWNTVAAQRWERFGDQVVEGDLVIANQNLEINDNEVDEEGEAIVRPADDDRAAGEEAFVRARALSKEEAESGKFSILDIVLPLPGFDVEYPANEIGKFYKDFMASEKGGGLDPYDMRRTWKDISLSGGYRKFLARPANMDADVKAYSGDLEQLVDTDLDRLYKAQNPNYQGGAASTEETGDLAPPEKVAVVIKMQLGSSQYATMALREMLKSGGLKSFKADFAR
jgi:tRNA pseudouridine13 synthase